MTRNIYLQGRMGELFGEVHRLNVQTVQEAMNAIDTMKGGVRTYLMDCTENGIEFTVQKGEDFMDYDTIGMELGKDDIIISPVPAGSISDTVKTIIGILLIVASFFVDAIFPGAGDPMRVKIAAALFSVGTNLALMGIIGLTTDDPEELDEEKSTMFNGPINNTKSGVPVPLAYGEMEVGGAVVNFGFTDYRIKGSQGYQFVSKGTNYGSGTGGSGGGGGGTGGGGSDGSIQWELK